MFNPRYAHVCDCKIDDKCKGCIFLGPWVSKDTKIYYDLYYSLIEGKYPSVFARFGNKFDDIISSPMGGSDINCYFPLQMAANKAIDMGHHK